MNGTSLHILALGLNCAMGARFACAGANRYNEADS